MQAIARRKRPVLTVSNCQAFIVLQTLFVTAVSRVGREFSIHATLADNFRAIDLLTGQAMLPPRIRGFRNGDKGAIVKFGQDTDREIVVYAEPSPPEPRPPVSVSRADKIRSIVENRCDFNLYSPRRLTDLPFLLTTQPVAVGTWPVKVRLLVPSCAEFPDFIAMEAYRRACHKRADFILNLMDPTNGPLAEIEKERQGEWDETVSAARSRLPEPGWILPVEICDEVNKAIGTLVLGKPQSSGLFESVLYLAGTAIAPRTATVLKRSVRWRGEVNNGCDSEVLDGQLSRSVATIERCPSAACTQTTRSWRTPRI
jgi:hypothetical protein